MKRYLCLILVMSGVLPMTLCAQEKARKRVPKVAANLKLNASNNREPIDMAVWVHPDPEQSLRSTIITSDPKAQTLNVFDLSGRLVQRVSIAKPGDVDVRYNFPVGKKKVDIVSVLQLRNGERVVIFQVDPASGKLTRIDNGSITTGEATGGCLFHSIASGKYYFFATSKSGEVKQIRLTATGDGKIQGERLPKRISCLTACRGVVADDDRGIVIVSEKRHGVWAFAAEPQAPGKGKLIAQVGKRGLYRDIEGVAFYNLPDGRGYLIVCCEGSDRFLIFDRKKFTYLGTFMVKGVSESEGIDVCNSQLGSLYPDGIFLCNTKQDNGRNKVLGTPWSTIARAFDPVFNVSTAWNPRDVKSRKQRPVSNKSSKATSSKPTRSQ